MFAMLSEAFLLGLSTAPFCAAACAPVFLPAVLSREDGRFRSLAAALGEFLLGRLIAYAAVGLAVGWVGAALGAAMPPWVMPASTALLGAALLLYAISQTARENAFCRAVRRWGGGVSFPLLLGFLTGVNLCPPFVAAMGQALRLGGALNGLAYFLSFFAATTLVSLPLMVVGLGSFLPSVQSLGRAACGVVGFIFLCTAARYAGLAARPLEVYDIRPEPALLRQLLPEAKEFQEAAKPARHFIGLASGRQVGVVVLSTDLAPEVRGFNGHVPVAVALDMSGRVVGAQVLPSGETPGYVRKIYAPEFAAQFVGKLYSEPMSLGRGVDGVTGATVTASAVTEGVRLTVQRAAEKVLGLEARLAEPAQGLRLNPWHLAVPVFFLLAWIGEAGRLRRLRPFLLAASVLCLGIGLRAFFSVKHILDIGTLQIPSLRENLLWYFLAVLALGSALAAGRLYCAWICPFGAVTELLGRLFHPFDKARGGPSNVGGRSLLEVSATWDRRLRRVKYAVLLGLPAVYLIGRNPDALYVEPFADAFTFGFLAPGSDAALRVAWLVFLVVASLFVFRFFCRYLCPAGAAMAFLARHRVFGRIRPDGCLECGECMVSCPKMAYPASSSKS